MNYKFRFKKHFFAHAISTPFIWAIIVPLVFLDIIVEIYHQICFPLYGLEKVRRSSYIRMDRQYLSYLNLFDKINCMYCGYANGLLAYIVVIVGRTESYWCGIKHKRRHSFVEPSHHRQFLEYGDKKTFERTYNKKK